MRTKTFAISVLNYHSLLQTVSLIKQLDARYCDIFVLDNSLQGDEGKQLEMLYKKEEHIFVQCNHKNRGFAGGNNDNLVIIQQTGTYDYLLLMNPDILVEEHFLEQFLFEIEQARKQDTKRCIFGPVIKTNYGGKERIQYGCKRTARLGQGYPQLSKGGNIDFVLGCCFALCFEKIQTPLFDEQYFLYYEEVDLCFHMRCLGYKQYITNNVYVTHQQDYLKKQEAYFFYTRNRSRLLFAKKRAQRYHRPTILVRTVVLVLYFGILTKGKAFKHAGKGVYHAFSNTFDHSYFKT